jgi:hypothetical protein
MRTLGSFNRLVSLKNYSDDHNPPAMPRVARPQFPRIAEDVNNPSNADKFASGRRKPGGERLSRFAGAALGVDPVESQQMQNQGVTFSSGTPSATTSSSMGIAELRDLNS